MAYTTIDDPSAYFQTAIYTGTGSSNSVTNDGNSDLQPDFIWIKERDGTGQHGIFDSSRGVQKELKIDDNSTESTASQSVTAFNSDGFTVGTAGDYNGSSNLQVAFQWKANGGTRTTFSESGDNPAGGRQVNTTAGFSIIDYTGTGANGTFAHGLNSAPTFWVVKPRSNVSDNQWFVCHQGLASDYATDFIHFDTNGAVQDNSLMWNDTAPTSSVITVGSKPGTNDDDGTFICYAWHDVQGFSKFGTYVGNASADGPFVWTGFKPAWIMLKSVNSAEVWSIRDNTRDTFNPAKIAMYADGNGTESDHVNNSIDLLSNGFKLRNQFGTENTSGGKFIYMAFAEHPFVSSKGVPCTAR